jgi:hypothetical protein
MASPALDSSFVDIQELRRACSALECEKAEPQCWTALLMDTNEYYYKSEGTVRACLEDFLVECQEAEDRSAAFLI